MGARSYIRARWWRNPITHWFAQLWKLTLLQRGEDARLIFLSRLRAPGVWLGYADYADLFWISDKQRMLQADYADLELRVVAHAAATTMCVKMSTDERGIPGEDLCENCGAALVGSNMCLSCGNVNLCNTGTKEE